jgi:hypothetical protein
LLPPGPEPIGSGVLFALAKERAGVSTEAAGVSTEAAWVWIVSDTGDVGEVGEGLRPSSLPVAIPEGGKERERLKLVRLRCVDIKGEALVFGVVASG